MLSNCPNHVYMFIGATPPADKAEAHLLDAEADLRHVTTFTNFPVGTAVHLRAASGDIESVVISK